MTNPLPETHRCRRLDHLYRHPVADLAALVEPGRAARVLVLAPGHHDDDDDHRGHHYPEPQHHDAASSPSRLVSGCQFPGAATWLEGDRDVSGG